MDYNFNLNRQQIIVIAIGVVAVIAVLFLFGVVFKKEELPRSVLEVWGVYDDPEVFKDLIKEYKKQNRNVEIAYTKKNFSDYEQALRNALSEDKGPDIWMIHNTWLPKHKSIIKPASMEFLPISYLRDNFVEVVEKDLADEGQVYGLPLYVDTLAMYYNKDFFNSAGISSPPQTWDELIDDVEKLVKKDNWGNVERAGASLGTAENINRAVDILSLLMLQNGTKMINDNKTMAIFNQSITIGEKNYQPGRDAFRFYTDFSNPSKRVYTWNRQMRYSIDAFIEGKTAIMFNYSHHIPTIKTRTPYLNFGVATMPQIKDREFDVNYASYWAFVVSRKTKYSEAAWSFLKFLSEKENSKIYLEKTQKPTARRDLIDWQKSNLDQPELGVFANQSLTAKSWYQIDGGAIEKIFSDAIESIVLRSADVNKAAETAATQVNLLMKASN